MKNNTVLVLIILLNVLKDIAAVGICGVLVWHFNNVWIILFALLFTGGYSIKFNERDKEDE